MPLDQTPATGIPRPLGALEKLFWLVDQNRPTHFAIAAEVGGSMRLHYAIAVVAVILIVFGVKLFFFQAPAVEAGIPPGSNASMNILQIHRDHPNIKDFPVLDVKDPF
jgi:hypothetical protein